jgi:hypothetical protein
MLSRRARYRASSLLLLAFTLVVVLLQPRLTQSETFAVMHVLQTTTTMTTTTGSMTSTSNQTTSTDTSSSSWQWDVLVPLLLMGIGASLAVMVAAVVAVRRRHPRAMPTVQLVCPRCRSPVSPYDAFCRNCRTPLYHPHRYYQPRR